jgi:hypothetical protein
LYHCSSTVGSVGIISLQTQLYDGSQFDTLPDNL